MDEIRKIVKYFIKHSSIKSIKIKENARDDS